MTRGHGDMGTRGHGDMETRGGGDVGMRGGEIEECADSEISLVARRSFPSSSLGTQARKLQLPARLGYQVAPPNPTKLELPSRWVPKLELGNQP
jgi:hypothetical protein